MNNPNTSGGLDILGVIQIIFIVLKILDIISCPWPVVFIPLFIIVLIYNLKY